MGASDILIIAAGVCLGKLLTALACGVITQVFHPQYVSVPEKTFMRKAWETALMFIAG